MNYIISDKQKQRLTEMIQNLIDSKLDAIKIESEDWGMGEMDEIDEVQSVDKIVINRIQFSDKMKVHIDIYKNSNRYDFDNLRAEIQYRLENWFPNIELYIEDVIDERKFGPGIDW